MNLPDRTLFVSVSVLTALLIVACGKQESPISDPANAARSTATSDVIASDPVEMEFATITEKQGHKPLVLSPGQSASGNIPASIIIHDATVKSIGVLQSNFSNTATGNLAISICQDSNCVSGSADLTQSKDNSVLNIPLAKPMKVVAKGPLKYTIKHDGGQTPVALWTFPTLGDSNSQELRGSDNNILPDTGIQLQLR